MSSPFDDWKDIHVCPEAASEEKFTMDLATRFYLEQLSQKLSVPLGVFMGDDPDSVLILNKDEK